MQELQRLQEAAGGKTREQRVDWMYAAPAEGSGPNPDELEAYLLGKKRVDKLLKGNEEKVSAHASVSIPCAELTRSFHLCSCSRHRATTPRGARSSLSRAQTLRATPPQRSGRTLYSPSRGRSSCSTRRCSRILASGESFARRAPDRPRRTPRPVTATKRARRSDGLVARHDARKEPVDTRPGVARTGGTRIGTTTSGTITTARAPAAVAITDHDPGRRVVMTGTGTEGALTKKGTNGRIVRVKVVARRLRLVQRPGETTTTSDALHPDRDIFTRTRRRRTSPAPGGQSLRLQSASRSSRRQVRPRRPARKKGGKHSQRGLRPCSHRQRRFPRRVQSVWSRWRRRTRWRSSEKMRNASDGAMSDRASSTRRRGRCLEAAWIWRNG